MKNFLISASLAAVAVVLYVVAPPPTYEAGDDRENMRRYQHLIGHVLGFYMADAETWRKRMTKDEAANIYMKTVWPDVEPGTQAKREASRQIDVLVALGILKVEDPKTATERALETFNHYFNSEMDSASLCMILEKAKVRIVDAT